MPPQTPDEAPSLVDLRLALDAGDITVTALVEWYLARIEAIDRGGPMLGSVIEVNPAAQALAVRFDRDLARKRRRGALHGLPILVKDNIATGDRMQTTSGSLALVGARPPADAGVVARLRRAGALILGKTNLSEWAEFRSQRCVAGWSGRGGQTRNPYALDRSPMGSSAGSAVAVAAGLCAAALGTETDGSIVLPANNNGVVGVKPTVGLVSRHGVVPISSTQDTPGVLARSVADAALLLSAVAGPDPADSATRPAVAHCMDYTTVLDPRGLRGARIGVARADLFGHSDAADAAAERAIRVMKDLGAVVVDPANLATLGQFDGAELEVMAFEMNAGLRRYLAWVGVRARVRSVRDVVTFNDRHAARELPYFGQELLALAAGKGSVSTAAYRTARAKCRRLSRIDGIDRTMNAHRLDALVAPTWTPAALIDPVNGDGGSWAADSICTIAAVAGYPHVSVPMGFHRGLPMGLSFVGRPWSEALLLRLAYAYERATRARRPPTLAPSAAVAPEGSS